MKVMIENKSEIDGSLRNIIIAFLKNKSGITQEVASKLQMCLNIWRPGRYWVYRGGSHIAIHCNGSTINKGERQALITD